MKILIYKYLGSIVLAMLLLLSSNEVFGEENSTILGSERTGLKVGVFDVDVTPPIGSPLAYNPVVNKWDMGLRAKGIVLLGAAEPIVLLAIDWIGISYEDLDEFKRVLAKAAGTIPQRVAVHSVHQHDAPRGDTKSDFVFSVLQRLDTAVKQSIDNAHPVTHLGVGEAEVYKVASNRRIMGADGHVRANRMSSCSDPDLRAEPEGLIDPMVSLVSFWNGENPLAVLSFYGTHPQSYYRTGIPNPDFPGIARFFRQLAVPKALHIYFTGASGDIAAGKYNDGSHENRLILAERLADGMKRAWEATEVSPVNSTDAEWRIEPVALVPNKSFMEKNPDYPLVQRYKAGIKIDIQSLAIGKARILFMPQDPFIEYQLAAKAMRPDLFVAMAAHGERAGYIPTARAFTEGDCYEVRVSMLTPDAENVVMTAIRKLLKVD